MAETEGQNLDDVQEVRRKGREMLSTDLLNLVNSPEDSDVVFKCSDGKPVYGCRWLLASRCPVFKSLLKNGMLETKLSEIPLGVPSTSVLSIVEYLYTGTIDAYPPGDWKRGFELISAAQFFMIPMAEAIARNFLQSQASKVDGTAKKSILMDMLSVAVDFPETWEGKDVMLLQLIKHIGESWYEEDCSHSLSRSTVGYILSHSGADGDREDHKLDVEEYFNFRKLILWHVYRSVPKSNSEAREAVQKALPGKEIFTLRQKVLLSQPEIDAFVTDLETSISTKARPSTDALNALVQSEICRDTLEYLLGYINVSRIPASLFVRFVHPIGVIAPGPLLKSLVHRALQERVQYSVRRSDWKHGPWLRTGERGQIMCENRQQDMRSAAGIAITFIPPAISSDVYEWSFEVLEDDAIIELGFTWQGAQKAVSEGTHLRASSLCCISEARYLRANKADTITLMCTQRRESSISKVEKNSAVKFKFSKSKRTCEVHLNNTFGGVWEFIPDEDCFPAVGFYASRLGKVQLRLINGFDYF